MSPASKRSTTRPSGPIDQQGREKIESRSDLNFVIDIINTALARPDIKTFLLFTGDKDFIRVVTTLRNRLGKRVVICGVPGSVSPDLVAAAGEEDPLQMSQSADVDISVIRAIDALRAATACRFRADAEPHEPHALAVHRSRSLLPSEHIEAKVMEFLRKGILTKRQTINGQNQELITTELNPDHPLVQKALPEYAATRGRKVAEENGYYDADEDDDEYEDDELDEQVNVAVGVGVEARGHAAADGDDYEDEFEDEYEDEAEPPQPLTSR